MTDLKTPVERRSDAALAAMIAYREIDLSEFTMPCAYCEKRALAAPIWETNDGYIIEIGVMACEEHQ